MVGRAVSGLHDEALGWDEVLDSHELLWHATCLLDMLGLLLTLKQFSFLAFLCRCRRCSMLLLIKEILLLLSSEFPFSHVKVHTLQSLVIDLVDLLVDVL